MPSSKRTDADEYLKLVAEHPLRPITSEAALRGATRMMHSLLDRKSLSKAAEDYLDVLSDLVEKYEEARYPIGPGSDADLLRHLMDARGITAAELAEHTGIVSSTLSNVMTGKRSLNRDHIGALMGFFHVPAGVFEFGTRVNRQAS
ncbi:MAG: helix-turn-helix domain-containing protein [Planctomycetota bacterium]